MSSESDQRYAMMDEKKRKRMISNRESARRSRMKKQKVMQDLTEEVGRLQVANSDIVGKIDGISKKYVICASENNVLRAHMMELSERLRSLNDVIKNCEKAVDATRMMDPVLNTWQQFPCSMQPIPASQRHLREPSRNFWHHEGIQVPQLAHQGPKRHLWVAPAALQAAQQALTMDTTAHPIRPTFAKWP